MLAGSTAITAASVAAGGILLDVMLVTFNLKIHNALILRVKQALLHGLLGLEDDSTMML